MILAVKRFVKRIINLRKGGFKVDLGFHINKYLLNLSKKHRLSTLFIGDPMVLELEVTTYCNAKCIQCTRQGEYAECVDMNRHMPFDKFKLIINKFPYLERITFSGMGEPFLCPDIFNAIDHIKNVRERAVVATSTNSAIFIKPGFIDKIIDSKLDILQISWIGAREETVERIGGVKHFNRIVAATRELVQKKQRSLRINLNFVLMEENYKELEELVRLVHSVGIKNLIVNRRNYYSFSKTSFDNSDFYDSVELTSVIERSREVARTLGVGLIYNQSPKCTSIWDYTYINIDGYVLPCGSHDLPKLCNLGNILTDNKKNIYRSPLLTSLRRDIAAGRKPDFCRNCYVV